MAEGKAEGLALSLLTVLSARDVALTEAQREQVTACRDEATLNRWLRAAVTATTAGQVFAAKKSAKPRATATKK